MLEGLRRDFETVVLTPESEAATPAEAFQAHGPWAALLGRRTAELHAALAIETDDPAFAAEPFTEDDLEVLAAGCPPSGRARLPGAQGPGRPGPRCRQAGLRGARPAPRSRSRR